MNPPKHSILWFLCILWAFYITGCSPLGSGGVQLNNEAQLEQEGFISKLNQQVDLGDEKVVFQKAAFDRNSITFVYKGRNIQLSNIIVVKGIERKDGPRNFLEHMDETKGGFGVTVTGDDYGVVKVPHNLELVNQSVSIEINLNGKENQFEIDFPGEKIASATRDVMVDSTGKAVNEGTKAAYRVIVGIGSTVIETKGNNDFIIIDRKAQKVLGHSSTVSTTAESTQIFEPISFPRKQIEIRILPEEKQC